MNKHLQNLMNILQQDESLAADQKQAALQSLKDADKELEITEFKLERTEKVKRTTAILLEETIGELEQKRKAVEEQNHELEIESALERVRTVAMGMRKPDDLLDICEILFKELYNMGFAELRNTIINIHDDVNGSFLNYDYSIAAGKTITNHIYQDIHPVIENQLRQIRSGEDAFSETVFAGKDLEDWKEFRKRNGEPDDPKVDGIPALFYYLYSIGSGSIGISTYSSIPGEKKNVLKHFRNVFDLAYRRYMDITNAEEQAREAQIQLALERVRARTMAMQKSDELREAANLLFHQVKALGLPLLTCGYNIWDKEDKICSAYMSDEAGLIQSPFKIPLTESPTFIRFYNSRQKGESFYAEELSGEALAAHYRYMLTLPVFGEIIDGFLKAGFTLPTFQINNVANFSQGNLIFITYKPVPEAWDIFKRFAKVFEQTYIRFLDLQKAEAQAREAQIELGLERVRARAMAMQKSDELSELVDTVFKELTKLDFALNWCIINIIDESSLSNTVWAANPDIEKAPESYHMKFEDYPFHDAMMKGYKERATKYIYVLEGLEKKVYDEYLFKETEFRRVPEEAQAASRAMEKYVVSFSFSNFGGLQTVGNEPLSEANLDILARFGKVFDLTYTRFNDLQKAEAQVREAQIEAALERVRSRTMAMQRSEELAEVATVLFQQVRSLGVPQWTCGFSIFEIDDKEFTWYPGGSDGEILPSTKIPLTEHPVFISFNESRKRGDELFVYEKGGEFQSDHYRYMRSLPGGEEMYQNTLKAGITFPAFQIDHVANFSHGNLVFITYEHFPEMHDVFKRFAKVFEQTYTRFLDLQKAEAQALEAIKRASVDRVRAEIASMRTTNDLEKITPLIWNELTTLGVPFIRCGVFIMDEGSQHIHTFLSTPAGKAIATLHVPFDFNLQLTRNGVDHWRRKKVYQEHWDTPTFIQSWKALSALRETSVGTTEDERLPENLYLHLLPFLQGMLYVGSEVPLTVEAMQLSQNLADAFSTAYARYEDFNKLETAKKEVDSALNQLQATQKQLIQSEKMASLGELTAGIAHEIQNPLNFVNNFSDVNKELLAEMKDEMRKGNIEDANAIADDVISNEEKINHHGKRADSIVKGMLQHSRSSTGVKEPTDFNALADEYLRLAYHGLRAKDKSFNTILNTDFDTTIPKINITPQDIGRVLLNLYNNAFYAVDEKKKAEVKNLSIGEAGYQPAVSVSTKRIQDKVVLTVKDNGNGIPQNIVDKIFQPFFTTKPTGQGTGLGLSLSYDIIKAHDGELKLNTREGEGAEFMIYLTLNENIIY
jgi:signal transduction histidine kinase